MFKDESLKVDVSPFVNKSVFRQGRWKGLFWRSNVNSNRGKPVWPAGFWWKITQVAFPNRRPSKDFNEPAIVPPALASLSPPVSSLQKRRNSFDPKDEDEEEVEGIEENFMARLRDQVGSDLTSFRTNDRTFGPSEGRSESLGGARGLGSGSKRDRRDSGVPVRITFLIRKIFHRQFLCTDDAAAATEISSRGGSWQQSWQSWQSWQRSWQQAFDRPASLKRWRVKVSAIFGLKIGLYTSSILQLKKKLKRQSWGGGVRLCASQGDSTGPAGERLGSRFSCSRFLLPVERSGDCGGRWGWPVSHQLRDWKTVLPLFKEVDVFLRQPVLRARPDDRKGKFDKQREAAGPQGAVQGGGGGDVEGGQVALHPHHRGWPLARRRLWVFPTEADRDEGSENRAFLPGA